MKGIAAKGIWAAAIAYALALAVVSLLPSGGGGAGTWDAAISPTVQNTLHVPAYAALVILLVLAVSASSNLRLSGLMWIGLACCAFGTALELAQAAIPGRMGSLSDTLLNVVGVVVAIVGTWLWRRSLRRARSGPEVT